MTFEYNIVQLVLTFDVERLTFDTDIVQPSICKRQICPPDIKLHPKMPIFNHAQLRFAFSLLTILCHHEFASISAHFALISSFFAFAFSRLIFVLSSLCARRHLLTCVFALLHIPSDFHRKPRAWHSSRAIMTSSHAVLSLVVDEDAF